MLVPVMLGVALVVFSIMYLTPGVPASLLLGVLASQEEILMLRNEMGLNDPFVVQYLRFVFKAATGNLGTSLVTGKPVISEIWARFPATLQLAFWGVVVAILIGIPVGIVSATKQYSLFDTVSMLLALVGVSMPNFWQGLMTILLFSVYLKWLPPFGYGTPAHLVMPAITLGTSTAAIVTRMTRSSMLEIVRQDYIRTARAKGLPEGTVIMRHALMNALIPIITVVGLQFGYLLGGAILTETVFSWPGVGTLLVASIKQKDFPMVQGAVVFIAVVFSLVNLAVDVLYAFVDPRIKSQYR